ncbi:MAG: hypothetical protein ACRDRZ_13120 [Pseudonocardiaceae bacterium]
MDLVALGIGFVIGVVAIGPLAWVGGRIDGAREKRYWEDRRRGPAVVAAVPAGARSARVVIDAEETRPTRPTLPGGLR